MSVRHACWRPLLTLRILAAAGLTLYGLRFVVPALRAVRGAEWEDLALLVPGLLLMLLGVAGAVTFRSSRLAGVLMLPGAVVGVVYAFFFLALPAPVASLVLLIFGRDRPFETAPGPFQ